MLAVTAEDFEVVRQIRNDGREWMADSREISPEDQERFRAEFKGSVWVYRAFGKIVGYGLIKHGTDDYAYVSLAVHPSYRGRGLGRQIYHDLRSRWSEDPELWAVIKRSNTPSIMAALAAGYVITARITSGDTIALRAEVLR